MWSDSLLDNWEMPVREVPPCRWDCSNPEDVTSSCWKLCRNNINIVNQIIEITEHKKTDH